MLNPSSFIRLWFERVRRRFGHSIKHAVFQEFGTHPELGNEPRLHFHGVLWDVSYSYNAFIIIFDHTWAVVNHLFDSVRCGFRQYLVSHFCRVVYVHGVVWGNLVGYLYRYDLVDEGLMEYGQ